MTLILTCFNREFVVGIADSAIIDVTIDCKRIRENAQKVLRIPYLNGYISYYGDAEIGGESTENTIKRIIQEIDVNTLNDFSDKFGALLNQYYQNVDRAGFHIVGFDKEGEFCFFHLSNEDPKNNEMTKDRFVIVSPNKEELKNKYSDPRYVYFFFNGEHKIFQIIFENYKFALIELQKSIENKNQKIKCEQMINIGKSLMQLIIATTEMFGHENIGGNINYEVIYNEVIIKPNYEREANLSQLNKYSSTNVNSTIFNAGSFAPH